MKLNGWVRIGIVLSALWAIAVICSAALEYRSHALTKSTFISWHTKTGEDYAHVAQSSGRFADLVPFYASVRFANLFGVLLLPLVAAWIVSYFVVYTTLWVMNGFRTKKT